MTFHLYLALWLPPSVWCLLTKVFFAVSISHACFIPTHLTCGLIILIKWIKHYEILIMYLSKNCCNNMHCIMILKSSYTLKLYTNMFGWWPPWCWLPLKHAGI
jgi:hypothetical protein